MTPIQIQPAVTPLDEQLSQRLMALGASAVTISALGALTPLTPLDPVLAKLLHAPALTRAVHRAAAELAVADDAIAVWPGVWLVLLPQKRRSHRGDGDLSEDRIAGLFFGDALLSSEFFHLLCDQAGVDATVVRSRINPDSLVSPREVQRLARALVWMRKDSVENDRRVRELYAMSQQLAESYEELSLLYKMSTGLVISESPVEFITESCVELQQVVGFRWMAMRIADSDDHDSELAGRLMVAGRPQCSHRRLDELGKQLLKRAASGTEPLVIDDTRLAGIPDLAEVANQLLVVTMVRDGVRIGVLFAGDKVDDSEICTIDTKLCSAMANSIAMFVQNNMLFDDMQSMFMGTLHALTASIDAKDRYTHGHSERVALLSRMLAEAAGFDAHTVERVYIAGLIHDVGKIGVPEAVLCKPGRLTAPEFEMIKEHPTIGARILQDIKQMNDLIPGVLYHHERWDGRGYPNGLQGQDIPIMGRLIALADAFDAMSTNRTYRQALTHEKVLEEIRTHAGAQFDPDLADLFLRLDFAPFHEAAAKHQKRDTDRRLSA